MHPILSNLKKWRGFVDYGKKENHHKRTNIVSSI